MIDWEKYRERVAVEVERRWGGDKEQAIDGMLQVHAACMDGDCAYACDRCVPIVKVSPGSRSVVGPIRHGCKSQHTCMGYEARKHIEGGMPILRYRLCPRQRAWWREQQHRIRAAKAAAPSRGKQPSEWQG
jgi:hypothetical protein